MRVNRRFMYWGVFLAAIGGVLVAADLGAVDTAAISSVLWLWPLALVAIGLGIALRRTRFGLAGGLLAAAMPGLVLGGGLAAAPRIAVDCGAPGTPTSVSVHDGTFDGPARVSVETGCGTFVVTTAPGATWQFESNDDSNRSPVIESSGRSLSIGAGGRQDWHWFDQDRDAWRLTLPTSELEDLSLVVNAGDSRIDLTGAQLGRLDVTANAAQARVDASGASVGTVSGTVNAGRLSLELPSTADIAGTMEVNAGALEVCVPSGLGLRVHHVGVLSGISVNGLQQSGRDWQSPDYQSAAHRADLNVNINLGSVEINPIGGCK